MFGGILKQIVEKNYSQECCSVWCVDQTKAFAVSARVETLGFRV